MTKKVQKIVDLLIDFADSNSGNPDELAAKILSSPHYLQEKFFRVCEHYIYTVASRGTDGDYQNWPSMEYNSTIARRMVNGADNTF